MGWHGAHQDTTPDRPRSQAHGTLLPATCLGWENVTQPKESVPRASFAHTPMFLQVAGCVQALLPEHISSDLFIPGIHSTQPPEYPHPGPSWAHSSSALPSTAPPPLQLKMGWESGILFCPVWAEGSTEGKMHRAFSLPAGQTRDTRSSPRAGCSWMGAQAQQSSTFLL